MKIAHLYTGNEWDMPVITEHVTVDTATGTGIIAEEFLMSLEPGEYFISIEPVNEQGQTVGLHCLRLVVEEETTYISPQQGFASLGSDWDYIFNDLQNIQPITLSCYNLGDDRIIKFQEISDGIGNQNLVSNVDSQYYEISEAGNSVTLKEEYLRTIPEYYMRRFQVTLASGKTINSTWHYLLTVDGEIDWLTVNGPTTYSLSAGGDYVADIYMGWGSFIEAFYIIDQENGFTLVDEYYGKFEDLSLPSVDEENHKIIISEERMQTLDVGKEYNFCLKYQSGGTASLAAGIVITIVP
ncbi:MAG: hypothetical protein J6J12_05560 [Oscillospiraceae bacterium]|nr:hypothetical protein [Oscillospiraceae bacterium]